MYDLPVMFSNTFALKHSFYQCFGFFITTFLSPKSPIIYDNILKEKTSLETVRLYPFTLKNKKKSSSATLFSCVQFQTSNYTFHTPITFCCGGIYHFVRPLSLCVVLSVYVPKLVLALTMSCMRSFHHYFAHILTTSRQCSVYNSQVHTSKVRIILKSKLYFMSTL